MKLPFVSRKKYNKLMDDYEEAVYKLECLLCHATGKKFSKHTYDLSEMEMAVDDYIDDLCNEAVQDVKEVKHGRWIIERDEKCPKFYSIYCSNCSYQSMVKYKYCPRCGAKMDEEEQE